MITQEQIQILYKKYSDIVKLEVSDFGCKPTEVRHLIGRLGEFYCALHVGGNLSHEANQHGFDVISKDNRKISVKTTAQKSGFVAINSKTLNKVDDLMLLQYKDENLEIVYYGDIDKAIKVSRMWEGKYELDISKAKKIS
ncbi:hypothetical protein [uncultured Gammaproteobacteria bacterium]|jgi:hypothetical protein|nr:hypothetical protein [uncultured Gammaproteobacteria bacterium]CAC9562549.1 hypothetical protein [uncultured Gammaproteobacteria bacterium]CAC9567313.1 hypothetical protein [uncultured Gammaproteobacteria bacterium]CAC9571855.1 hypothetical protein [uncultured Gammaproteobacteria bacterium]CAC9572900.1 hypothetical protein [uncultured Gammaproteobacteria bacterium]